MRGTQVSPHTLFGRTREQFQQEAHRTRTSGGRDTESFWFAERTVLQDFPAKGR